MQTNINSLKRFSLVNIFPHSLGILFPRLAIVSIFHLWCKRCLFQTAVLYLTANNDPESLESILRWPTLQYWSGFIVRNFTIMKVMINLSQMGVGPRTEGWMGVMGGRRGRDVEKEEERRAAWERGGEKREKEPDNNLLSAGLCPLYQVAPQIWVHQGIVGRKKNGNLFGGKFWRNAQNS